MAANICSDENNCNNAELNSPEVQQICTDLKTELSETDIPTLQISSLNIAKDDEIVAQLESKSAIDDKDEPVENESSINDNDTKCNGNTPSNDLLTKSVTDTIMSDSMTNSMVETDAVPLENPQKSSLEVGLKSSDASKSSLTESASSKITSSPVDEDDAGPFNQNAYRQHLKGGNLCYETFTIKDSPYYNINEGKKLALIINHENYNHYDHQNIPRRTGTRRVRFLVFNYHNPFCYIHM